MGSHRVRHNGSDLAAAAAAAAVLTRGIWYQCPKVYKNFFLRENLKLGKIFSSSNNYFSLCKLEKRLSSFSFKNRKLP